MSLLSLFFIAAGLSMDAFAVSVCKGLAAPAYRLRQSLVCGLWFGFFQGLMPAAGYMLGIGFARYIIRFDHWAAFLLLGVIGFSMIKQALGDEESADPSFGWAAMLTLALATSVDALAIGITFAFLGVNIFLAAAVIGGCTFFISAAGVKIGSVFGAKWRSKAELIGGIILIVLGVKILAEHLLF